MIRQPIITVLGHVDHGKTTLLDKIRSTATASREAGGITQHIGASEVPIEVIEKISGPMLKKFGGSVTIPGLLFIDTPGHEAFTNLRKRGGSVADLAILVVDATKNFEPQTYEALEILKDYKTPFLIAANKIDLVSGWRDSKSSSFSEALSAQQAHVVANLEQKIYEIIGKISEVGFNAERFDRVKDFRKEVVILPVSAKTGEGIAELLAFVTGISQRFLEDRLEISVDEPGKGSILERKEERGLGSTVDVILYNGTLKTNDVVAFASLGGIGTAKVKALLKPKPLQEMRESRSKFYYVDSVSAASGVKISGAGLEDALPGSLLISTAYPNYENEILGEMAEVFAVESKGLVLKADTIGTLEALSKLLKDSGIGISKKGLGNVNKRDVVDAFSIRAADPLYSVVLAFNVDIEQEAADESYTTGASIISSGVIYKLIDDYKAWAEKERALEKQNVEKTIPLPGALRILPNHCFRISHPAVFGADIIAGRMRPSYLLMNEKGRMLGRLKEIQDNGKPIQEARKGDSYAVSMDDVVFGRQVNDNDILYTHINDEDMRLLRTKYSYLLSDEEKELLNKIADIKRQQVVS